MSKYIKKVGLICDLNYTRSIAMMRNYHCINNLFSDVKIVSNESQLSDIEILFVADPFFGGHKFIWSNKNFINTCNNNNIKVCNVIWNIYIWKAYYFMGK